MSDDRLLAALGALYREQQGEKTPPAELLTPPSDAVKETIVARAMAALHAELPRTTEVPAAPARGRSWSPRFWLWLGAPAALAAGVALFVHGRDSESLPAYAMEVHGGVAEYRAGGEDAGGPLLIEEGSSVEMVLRPQADTARAVTARAFWVKGGEVRAWTAEVATSPQGAVRLRGPGERPFGAGDGEIAAVVAPAGREASAVSAAALSSPHPGWQVFRRRVRWK